MYIYKNFKKFVSSESSGDKIKMFWKYLEKKTFQKRKLGSFEKVNDNNIGLF